MAPDGGHEHRLLHKVVHGIRIWFVRGLVARAISISSNLLLIALVTPAEFGILAVVRGLVGIVSFIADLGFEQAFVRRAAEPTRAQLASVHGLRIILLGMVVCAWFIPGAGHLFGILEPRWSGWTLLLLISLLPTAFQLGSKILLERQLAFTKLAVLEVSLILLQNGGLVVAALTGRFVEGIFLVYAATCLYATLMVHWMLPTQGLSFDLRPLRGLLREGIGFSLSRLVFMTRTSLTPIVIARAFGLETAGLWAFAERVGQFMYLAFEGYLRAGFAAAARMAHDVADLRELATTGLRTTARMSYPAAGVVFACLPLLALYWSHWADAVGQAQIYVLTLGVAGAVSAALSPVVVAVRGSRIALANEAMTTGTIWILLALLWAMGTTNVALAYAAGAIASAVAWVRSMDPALRPPWLSTLSRPLLALATIVGLYVVCRILQASPWLVAGFACAAAVGWGLPDLLGVLRLVRGARPIAKSTPQMRRATA